MMTESQHRLWEKLEAFDPDESDAVLTFSRRLARENGWSHAYAKRVVAEYKRFVFLAMESGHPVSPSEPVDQAWHLHLTYTESYWQRMCAEILGRRLHHRPTKGGDAEAAKFDGMYARTIASYRAMFGCKPPGDIWADPQARDHNGPGRHRWVDASEHWIIPKRWLVPFAVLGGGGIGLAGIAGCQIAVGNPFESDGVEFLGVFVMLVLIGFAAAYAVRTLMCGPHGRPGGSEIPSDLYEIAHLGGGPSRVLQCALVSLEASGAAVIQRGRRCKVKRSVPDTPELHDVELLVWDALPADGSPVHIDVLKERLRPAIDRIGDNLFSRGLLAKRAAQAAVVGLAVALAVPLLGIVRIVLGIAVDRPVGFLVVLCVIAIGIAMGAFVTWKRQRRSSRGAAAFRELRRTSRLGKWKPKDPIPTDVPVAFAAALFGLAVLDRYRLDGLRQQLESSAVYAGAGCGSCGGGCGSGCGGGGGCGGCGGD